MATCRFCPELEGDVAGSDFHRLAGEDFGSRFIRESDNFAIFPTVGQIIPGYLLIVPKFHCLSTGHLPLEAFDELESMVVETGSKLAELYGCRPIFFEHGPVSASQKGGCCVDHAHVHAVPASVDLSPRIRQFYPESRITRFADLSSIVAAGTPYLFFRNTAGESFAYEAPICVSQFLRQILAIELGVPERWDWRAYPGIGAIHETLRKLAAWRNVDGRLDFSRMIGSTTPSSCSIATFEELAKTQEVESAFAS